jgi:hypothetical protein
MLIGLQEAGHAHHWISQYYFKIHFLWLSKLPTEDWLLPPAQLLKPSREIPYQNSRSNKKKMGEQGNNSASSSSSIFGIRVFRSP